MRIGQLTGSLIEPLGGAEQYCLALARHQRAEGHDVVVMTGWADDSVVAHLAADGIPVTILPTARPYSPDRHGGSVLDRLRFHALELLDSVRRTPATRRIEREGLDVLHVHRFAGFGASVLRVRGPRVVHTVHDYTLVDTSATLVRDGRPARGPSRLQRARAALIARGLENTATLVFPSARTRDRHTEWGFPTAEVESVVIPHGWPTQGEPPDVAKDPSLLEVLYLGKLSPHKGIDVLLDAWGTGVPGAVLRIAGDGPSRALVDANPAVDSLGWLDEDARIRQFARADVLVFPSEWPENFPIVVAESMLAGVPVVTTTTASPPLVDHLQSGLVVVPGATALREAIVLLSRDENLRLRLASGARARADQLDMAAHGRRVMDTYLHSSPHGARP